MNAIPAIAQPLRVRDAAIIGAALAYRNAENAFSALNGSTDKLLWSAYLAVESAIASLKGEGTMLREIAILQDMAHDLAPAYERFRNASREAGDKRAAARGELGYARSLPQTLFAVADEVGDESPADEALSDKIREVAEWIDSEDFT